MHIGLIVGIGPAATDYYYRYLISALAQAGPDLELTMAHADTKTLLRNQSEGNVDAQVEIYRRLTERLQRSGIERIAVTSIAGHFCIDAFKEVSPVPVIDLLDAVKPPSQSTVISAIIRSGNFETSIFTSSGLRPAGCAMPCIAVARIGLLRSMIFLAAVSALSGHGMTCFPMPV
jgi:hypothetical protein